MIEARLPGHTPIPFNTLKTVLAVALEDVARSMNGTEPRA
jgi:hypothetical protein